MKKIMITLAALAVAAVAQAGTAKFYQPAASAVGNWYVGGYGGASLFQSNLINPLFRMSEKHKIGYNAGIKLGYDFAPEAWMRPVLELDMTFNHYNRKAADFINFSIGSGAVMLNALAKFDCGVWQPYAGFGAGVYHARAKMTVGSYSETTWMSNFTYQCIVGTDYKLDANWALFTEYKWRNSELADGVTKGMLKSRVSQHIVDLGVRYQF